MKREDTSFVDGQELEAMLAGGKSFIRKEVNTVLPEGVDMLSPLNIKIGRPVMIVILEDNLSNIQENFKKGYPKTEELEGYIQSIETLLAWVKTPEAVDEDDNLFMSVYPVDMSPDDLDDLDEELELQ